MTISPDREVEIRRLHYVEHWPIGTIARQLGVHEDVVRRVIGVDQRAARSSSPKPRLVDPFLPFIVETLDRYPTLRATRIYDMIRDRGYKGSVRRLRDVVGELRPVPKSETFLRLELLIGE